MVNATKPDPSPSEIAAICLEIQATWTDEERLKRMRIDWRPTYRRCDGEHQEFAVTIYESHHENHETLNAA